MQDDTLSERIAQMGIYTEVASRPAWAQSLSLTEWTPRVPKPYIGKCTYCKAAMRAMITTYQQLRESRTVQGEPWLDITTRQECDAPQAQYHYPSHTWYVPCPTATCCYPRSTTHASLNLRAIDGTVVPGKKCDARCTGAKGSSCECSCGGENHGCDHG